MAIVKSRFSYSATVVINTAVVSSGSLKFKDVNLQGNNSVAKSLPCFSTRLRKTRKPCCRNKSA